MWHTNNDMDIASYIKQLPLRTFSKDELLMASGDPSDTFLAVRDGFIKVTSTDESGRQKLLWIAGRFDIVPLERFFTKKVLQYDYSGFSDGSAYVLKKSTLQELLRTKPELNGEIARGMSEHYDEMIERVSAIGQADVRRKLLHMLFTMATKFSSGEEVAMHELGLNLTHQDMADMIGASREVVSVELSKIRTEGYIDYSRSRLVVRSAMIKRDMNLLA